MLDLLLLAIRLQSAPSPPQPPFPVEIRIVPECRRCAVGREVSFLTSYRLDDGTVAIRRSTLDVEEVHGKVLFSFENPFCQQPGERWGAGNGVSNCVAPALLKRLAALPAGDYAVTWRVNEVESNTASFRLSRTVEPAEPLVIQPLVRHGETMAQPELLAHFTNTGSASLFLPYIWGGSSLIVDGVSYSRFAWMWSGTSDLGPGDTWGVVVALGEFGTPDHCAIRAGRHRVQLIMDGIRSNEITIEISRDDCPKRFLP
jgi:hypothetical protein